MQIRPLTTADLPRVQRIEADSYRADLREGEAPLLAKMALFRAGALGCFDGEELCGYAFALPWRTGQLIAVAQIVETLPDHPDVMYVHDMVVAPAHRRKGVASLLFGEIARLAAKFDLPRFALVAVQGSEPFWQRLGFEEVEAFEYVPGVAATTMTMTRPAP